MIKVFYTYTNETTIWNLGEERPYVNTVKSITADGIELTAIKNLQGIPMKFFQDEVTWFGDDAKFIVANL